MNVIALASHMHLLASRPSFKFALALTLLIPPPVNLFQTSITFANVSPDLRGIIPFDRSLTRLHPSCNDSDEGYIRPTTRNRPYSDLRNIAA